MGSASVASPADLNGLRSNPAGLAGLSSPKAAFTHLSAFSDWDHDWLAMAVPWGRHSLGIELLSSRLRPFVYYNAAGQEAGTLNAGSLVGTLGYAYSWGTLALGLNARAFRSQLAEFSNWGYAGDVGLQWKPRPWACLGAAIQHLGEETAYLAVRDPLPTLWRLGFNAQGQPTPELGMALSVETLQSLDPGRGLEFRLGAEAEFFKRLDLRIGTHMQDAAWVPSFGAGFKVAGLDLAYSYRPVESLGADHMLTLNLQDLSGLFPDEPGSSKK